jgi:hypothetical protein
MKDGRKIGRIEYTVLAERDMKDGMNIRKIE